MSNLKFNKNKIYKIGHLMAKSDPDDPNPIFSTNPVDALVVKGGLLIEYGYNDFEDFLAANPHKFSTKRPVFLYEDANGEWKKLGELSVLAGGKELKQNKPNINDDANNPFFNAKVYEIPSQNKKVSELYDATIASLQKEIKELKDKNKKITDELFEAERNNYRRETEMQLLEERFERYKGEYGEKSGLAKLGDRVGEFVNTEQGQGLLNLGGALLNGLLERGLDKINYNREVLNGTTASAQMPDETDVFSNDNENANG